MNLKKTKADSKRSLMADSYVKPIGKNSNRTLHSARQFALTKTKILFPKFTGTTQWSIK